MTSIATSAVPWLPAAELTPALELALAVADADVALLLLVSEAGDTLVPAIGSGFDDGQWSLVDRQHVGRGPFGLAMAEHHRVLVGDVGALEGEARDLAQALHVDAIDIHPLFGADGQGLGELVVMFRGARASDQADAAPRATELVERCARLVACVVTQARQRAEAERVTARSVRSERARAQFLARMSHELRTPLQSIAGYIELLRAGVADPLTPAQERMLARVHDSEEVLVHVIDDLITFARLETGRLDYQIDAISADEVVQIARGVIAPLAADRGLRLDVGTCRGLIVLADGDKLKQILVNVAASVVKTCRPGGTVSIACRADGDSARFDVMGDGSEIDAERLRALFDPYADSGDPLFDRDGGMGLGLAISRELAVGMRGHLTADNLPGRGTVLTLRLPRTSAPHRPLSQ